MSFDAHHHGRYERFHGPDKDPDHRDSFERDRDRIMFTAAIRRLAGVTQVASEHEGYVFHNRLTHTLEVAQIARRLAQKINKDYPNAIPALGGIDPDVVEGAALAHDIGHPPFGHTAEDELDTLLRAYVSDGFEGNAQTFRILTRLAVHRPDYEGLNLTRATLNAVLKYPSIRSQHPARKGVYQSEHKYFDWSRGTLRAREGMTPEAQIMDWADDIGYAVHDLEDFYKANLIPIHHLKASERERDNFYLAVFDHLRRDLRGKQGTLTTALERVLQTIPIRESFSGTRQNKSELRAATSMLIKRFRDALTISEVNGSTVLVVAETQRDEMLMLKLVTRHYVHNNSTLASQRMGQRRIIRSLFEILVETLHAKSVELLPSRFKERAHCFLRDQESIFGHEYETDNEYRIAADFIAEMTDQQALRMFQRLNGFSPGNLSDTIV